MADYELMRVPRLRLTAVLVAIGVLAGALIGAGPALAAGTAALKLNPDRGRPGAAFTAVYQFSPAGTVCPMTVTFGWDGRVLGTGHVTRAGGLRDPLCIAAVGAMPPPDDRGPGPHQVEAAATAGHPAQDATYTIEGGPSATPSRPTTGHTAAPTSTYDDTANQPGAGVNTSQGAVAPLDAGGSVLGASTADSGAGGGLTAWILIFGGLLVLGGLAIFGLLIYWSRRGGGDGPVDSDTDGAVDSDTDGPLDSDTAVFSA
jgi:hypothetical protein